MTALPHYYTALAPFRETFLSGHPVLTYHHVAPPRRGARIRGLYVSPKLFERQLSELRSSGFSTPALAAVRNASQSTPSVWLTFDDGFRDVFENGLPILSKYGFKGLVFLVAGLLGKTNEWQQRAGDVSEPLADDAQVRAWLAAGNEIGSHSLTHPRLSQIAFAAAREEISASKKLLEDRFGVPMLHFCYPYGDLNEPVRDLVVEAGYQTASTTVTGINPQTADPFMLKRFTARYASRNWKNLWAALRAWRAA